MKHQIVEPMPESARPQFRHRAWTDTEISQLVPLRLFDFFPRGWDDLLYALQAANPSDRHYLDILAKREPMDYFRHWICPRVPAWYPFGWKSEEPPRGSGSSWVAEWAPANPIVLGIEASPAIPEFGPRPPTWSPEEAAWQTAKKSGSRFLLDHRQGEVSVQSHLFIDATSKRSRQLIGTIYGHLCRLNQWMGVKPDPELTSLLGGLLPTVMPQVDKLRNEDFDAIERAYKTRLNLPADFFKTVLYAYWDQIVVMTVDAREPLGNAVFWAARLLHALEPAEYERCLRRVRAFQRQVLPRLARQSGKNGSSTEWRALIRAFRSELEKDALLNCVFHAEVFDGLQHLRKGRGRPGPARNLALDWVIYVTVTEFHRYFPIGAWVSLRSILNAKVDLSPAMCRLIARTGGGSAFDFGPPLVAAIARPFYDFSPESFERAYRRIHRRIRNQAHPGFLKTFPQQVRDFK